VLGGPGATRRTWQAGRVKLRSVLASLPAYVPGKTVPGAIKLASNETPYPPLPYVLEPVARTGDRQLGPGERTLPAGRPRIGTSAAERPAYPARPVGVASGL